MKGRRVGWASFHLGLGFFGILRLKTECSLVRKMQGNVSKCVCLKKKSVYYKSTLL